MIESSRNPRSYPSKVLFIMIESNHDNRNLTYNVIYYRSRTMIIYVFDHTIVLLFGSILYCIDFNDVWESEEK